MWRLCYNSHPLWINLRRRGMKLDTICVVCNRLDEDGAHLFLKCKTACKTWDSLGLTSVRELLGAKDSAREVVETIMAMKEDQYSLCCILLWTCWAERNRIQEGEPRRDHMQLAHSARVTWEEWKREVCQPTGRVARPTRRWEKPEGDEVKVNCDAAFNPSNGNGGWGCILRDSDGDVVAARRGRLEACLNPLQGKL